MLRLKVFIISIFLASLIVAVTSGPILIETSLYVKTLLLFWVFSFLYSHLSIVVRKGNVSMDYGIYYGLSLGLFAGPLGLFIFETIYRFTVYLSRKWSKTADPDEFLHTFYNIGAFALNHSIAYYMFITLHPFFQSIPFGFWILIILLVIMVSFLSDTYLIIILSITGDIKSRNDAIDFVKSRSLLDMGKIIFSNGLLLLFIQQQNWEMLIALFILNYLVSRSYVAKSQSMQHKIERDKFKQMAYTDFLTEVYNRAFMDKKMDEYNNSGENIGIIVSDIDTFKNINDTYNHAVGDRVIQHYAATLQSYLDDGDYLFRSGGEEFTIFLRNRDYQECIELAEKMKSGVETTPAMAEFKAENISIPYTASFGLYYYKTSNHLEIKKAYVYADHLLLDSKELGKNRVSVKNGLTDMPLSLRYN
ncbi:GGDEF domain-containing protein [Virgibacillus profundi]|uniref:GGDEF domain-containing protein n=1 Tax=Virgibacillus profundi TaxID=2024555 RepID=A0A2A2IHP8_9BACI|nr:GGDEF domain-containing protein [Virgibacillus profundi]PAV31521.1 GGDEF domain-containing protein [Virgibacillus profundi]PXY55707.1 GGDEF domain-containing protein [Virgibacillus profundi]